MVYASGAERILGVASASLRRHKPGVEFDLRVITDVRDPLAKEEASRHFPSQSLRQYDIGIAKSGSGQHGRLLDAAVKEVSSDLFLTIDSDCFPVADDWLTPLVEMRGDGIVASGILWPWIPPRSDLDHKSIEYRVRRQHCWNNTQVACQLVNTDIFTGRGWKFADPDGDDTNCGFMDKAREAGYSVGGLLPTHGPLPDDPSFDPELNRHESLIYGGIIYHHVGATRDARSSRGIGRLFFSARERVYREMGAEWMLNKGESHSFVYNREEEVAEFKMKQMRMAMVETLKKQNSLFGDDWA